jgi:hypothetical protein
MVDQPSSQADHITMRRASRAGFPTLALARNPNPLPNLAFSPALAPAVGSNDRAVQEKEQEQDYD